MNYAALLKPRKVLYIVENRDKTALFTIDSHFNMVMEKGAFQGGFSSLDLKTVPLSSTLTLKFFPDGSYQREGGNLTNEEDWEWSIKKQDGGVDYVRN